MAARIILVVALITAGVWLMTSRVPARLPVAKKPSGGVWARQLERVSIEALDGTPNARLTDLEKATVALVVLIVTAWLSSAGVVVLVLCDAVALAIGLFLVVALRRARFDHEVAVFRRQVPMVLELIAAMVSTGAPLRNAVETVVAVSSESGRVGVALRRVVLAIHQGLSEADAWLLLSEHPVIGEVAQDLSFSSRHGTAVVDILRHHSQRIAAVYRDGVIARAKTTSARAVFPLMLCFLPAFGLVGVVPIVASVVANLAS